MVGARKPASNALFLEDLQVAQRFWSGFHTIDEAQIKAFAAQFDPQPFHLDGEAAKATLFSGLAASGWHTAAITMKLLVESGLPLRGGIIGAGGEISWPKPTRPGDMLAVFSEVEEVTPSRSRTLQNREAEASALFERLLSLCNDVGLLAEEYDPHAQRQVGNFPQAFSHLALIGTALNLHDIGPAQQRRQG